MNEEILKAEEIGASGFLSEESGYSSPGETFLASIETSLPEEEEAPVSLPLPKKKASKKKKGETISVGGKSYLVAEGRDAKKVSRSIVIRGLRRALARGIVTPVE
jgi:hypothetical protein